MAVRQIRVDPTQELLVGTRRLCRIELTRTCDITVTRVKVECAIELIEIRCWKVLYGKHKGEHDRRGQRANVLTNPRPSVFTRKCQSSRSQT